MTSTPGQRTTLEQGAKIANAVELYRLGGLLGAVRDLAKDIHEDGTPSQITLDILWDYGVKVSNDLINGEARRKQEELINAAASVES